MKVIDLINWIANGKAPKKIIINGNILNLKIGKGTSYEFESGGGMLSLDYYIENNKLDTIVEVVEEKKEDKKIEKLGKYVDVSGDLACEWSFLEKKLKDKINEIIDYINGGTND